MTRPCPSRIALVGPADETAATSRILAAAGYEPLSFGTSQAFIDQALRDPPLALVLWHNAEGSPSEDVHQVLQHHFQGQDCAVILVGDGSLDDCEFGRRAECVLPAPLDPEKLLAVLANLEKTRSENGGQIPRILVVDDDQNIVLLGSHIVTGMGLIPIVAFDGKEAVEKIRSQKPDLVLLDINMPGMDGFQVIEAVKSDPVASLTPIIVFSARRSEDDKVRALKLGADDYVTKPFSLPELTARIDRLLKRTRTGVSASATTGLPGSVSMEKALGQRVRKQVPLGVIYLDVDNFKAFNDCYGFARGDSVIRQTADLMLEAVRAEGNPDDFVGHIGGDDFVVVTTPEKAVPIAEGIIQRFDRVAPLYYDRMDRERGYIEMEDRRGHAARFPIMSVSIAIVTNEGRQFHHAAQIADVAAQLKKFAKSRPGSLWVRDQRGGSEP